MKYILLLFMFTTALYSQWEPINTFRENTNLLSVFFNDDNHGWICGEKGALLRFDASKFQWEKQASATTNDLTSIGFFNNSDGLACGNNGTLILSSDGGINWSPIATGYNYDFKKIQILNQSTAYLAGGTSLLKSIDKGLNWTKLNIPGNPDLYSVFFTSENTGFAGSGSKSLGDTVKIFRTTDGGLTWTAQPISWETPWNVSIQSIHFIDSQTGYLGGGGCSNGNSGFLKKTTDGGLTWTDVSYVTSSQIHDLKFKDSQTGVLVGGECGYSKFLNVKTSVKDTVEIYHPEDYDINTCFITPNGAGWAAGGGGSIFYSENFSQGWAQIFSGAVDNVAVLESCNQNFYMGSIRFNYMEPAPVFLKGYYNNHLFKDVSQYNGNTGGGDPLVALCMPDSLNGYSLNGNVFPYMDKTTNGGYTWTTINNPDNGRGIFFTDKNNGWQFGAQIYYTSDGGNNWTLQFDPLITGFLFTSLDFINNQVGYACGADENLSGKVYKTTDGGASWINITIPVSGQLTSISFSNPDTGVVTGWGNTLLITYNGGLNWTTISSNRVSTNENMSDKPLKISNDKRRIVSNNSTAKVYREIKVVSTGNYVDAVFSKNLVMVASDEGKVLKSFDYGRTWSTDVIGEPVLEIKYDKNQYAIARTDSNVFLNRVGFPVTVEVAESILPEKFALFQNYPNPFNPATTIRYSIPQNSLVVIKIYDILGAEVTQLVNERKTAGTYEVNFNAKNLSSGTYFYKLTADNYTEVKKLVLLK